MRCKRGIHMVNGRFALLIRDKIKGTYFIIFMFVVVHIGIIINNFEPYTGFKILFPVLVVMLLSTTTLLKHSLIKLKSFEDKCKDNSELLKEFNILFGEKKNLLIIGIFIIMIVVYFLCLYKLRFFSINLMGLYILFLGGSTFLIALISYELYLRITFTLKKISEDNNFLIHQYNSKNPEQTMWLQQLFYMSQILRTASLTIGVLFVFENSMLYIVNSISIERGLLDINSALVDDMRKMPIEFWVIWIFILFSIGLAFPVIGIIQSNCIKKIISEIQTSFKNKVLEKHTEDELYLFPDKFSAIISLLQYVENDLTQKFMPKRSESFIRWLSSLLTCAIHITTLLALLS